VKTYSCLCHLQKSINRLKQI